MVTLSHDPDAAAGADEHTPLEETLIRLDPEWSVFRDLEIGTSPDVIAADYLLLHGRLGAALVDVAPGRQRDPVEAFRKFLDSERLPAFFPGFLPIIRLISEPGETAVEARLRAAFSGEPPLAIRDPDWVEAVGSLLVAPDPSESQPPAAPATPERRDEPAPPPFPERSWITPTYDPAPAPERVRRPIEFEPRPHGPVAEPLPTWRPEAVTEPPARRWSSPAVAVILTILLGGGAAWLSMSISALRTDNQVEPRSATIPLTPPLRTDPSLPNTALDRAPPADNPAQALDNGAASPIGRPLPAAPPSTPDTATAPPPPAATPGKPDIAQTPPSAGPVASTPAPSPPAQLATTEPPPATKAPPPLAQPATTERPAAVKALPAPVGPPATAKGPPAVKSAPAPAAKAAASAPVDKVPSRPRAKPVPVKAVPAPARPAPAVAGPPIDASDLPPLDAADLPPPPAPASPPPAAAASSAAVPPGAPSKPLSLLSRSAPVASSGNTGDITAPPPSTPAPAPPSAATAAEVAASGAGTSSQVCRIYTATKTVLGKSQLVKGLACRLPDGQWQLVTEAPDQ
jgi:hypothetical protein